MRKFRGRSVISYVLLYFHLVACRARFCGSEVAMRGKGIPIADANVVAYGCGNSDKSPDCQYIVIGSASLSPSSYHGRSTYSPGRRNQCYLTIGTSTGIGHCCNAIPYGIICQA